METLSQIWKRLADAGYETDKGSVHSYVPFYEQVLDPYRHLAINVLEIGLFNGHSLRMWDSYFTNAAVFGIDCDEQPHGGMADLRPMIAEETHNIIIGDATSEFDVVRLFGDKKWGLVIDDGSHDISAQLKTVEIFGSRMIEGGMIILEDIQDIDRDRQVLKDIACCGRVQILDRRSVKGRYDDVICLISF